MTPQLMQSIRLLQLTHTELSQYVEQEVEKNPLLRHETAEGDDPAPDLQPADSVIENPPADGSGAEDWFCAELDRSGVELSAPLDAAQEDVFPEDSGQAPPDAPELAAQWKSMPGSAGMGSDGYHDLDGFAAPRGSLADHVGEQIAFTFTDIVQRLVAVDLTDNLDPSGYLTVDPADTAQRLNVDASLVHAVLSQLQAFEPAGLFARDLAECLALQLRRRDRFDPAMEALIGNLPLLARRDFKTLKRLCGVDENDLVDMMAEIRTLDPKPGFRFDTVDIQTIVPDILVRPATEGGWAIDLNPDTLPRVLVDRSYYTAVMASSGKTTTDLDYLNTCLRDANWLTRSLDQRAKTIVKVAGEIVRQQSQFLERGVGHLRPLTLKSVADAIQMHESTVSRVTSNKYMMTPRGLFELKFFFTASIAASGGGESHSSESVRHRIRQLIDDEDPGHILSDDVIVGLLKKDGIDIARRTVAKYREAMNIASSVQRRREKRALVRAAM